ncbi:replication endonuclease [Erwinia sp. SLM-02]
MSMLNDMSENQAGYAFAWNTPKSAINPYLDPPDPVQKSALREVIALYAADNRRHQKPGESLRNAVWDRYFFNADRDPVLREIAQDKLTGQARMARERQRFNPEQTVMDDIHAQPAWIARPLLQRIAFLKNLSRPGPCQRYLCATVRPCLDRLTRVRDDQTGPSIRQMAGHPGLEGLLVLSDMNQNQVKRLSALVAAHMAGRLESACSLLPLDNDVQPEAIRRVWEQLAAEVMRLEVIPPAFEQLKRKRHRRRPVSYDRIPGSLARMICTTWWYRRLWQRRCEWREEQLRAVCLVSRKTSPYISREMALYKREQRRKSLEFFRAHELINEHGDRLEMEAVVRASTSHPVRRRNEMMACLKGLELIAEMRGDRAIFYTLTCPSRFHATLSHGQPNPMWAGTTVRQSSEYLVGVFAAFRKAMHKAGLRWYGIRVAEPHHDGTVHWHLLCFMPPGDCSAITALLRRFAIKEDRQELGKVTEPRFKANAIDSRKGTPTGYIAKYISKNIDGRGLGKHISKETGTSLRDSAEHVTSWASLHRIQQFRFFGIPGRQAWRELRLLAGQVNRQHNGRKAGAPVLADRRLDAVLAAADAGCFATYISRQGGVLVPRRQYLVRTAYELSDVQNKYGDRSRRIYGIWSPLTKERICTHSFKWKRVRKTSGGQISPGRGHLFTPWTRGNNCPHGEKINAHHRIRVQRKEEETIKDFKNEHK